MSNNNSGQQSNRKGEKNQRNGQRQSLQNQRDQSDNDGGNLQEEASNSSSYIDQDARSDRKAQPGRGQQFRHSGRHSGDWRDKDSL
jgi:hypothetical protein